MSDDWAAEWAREIADRLLGKLRALDPTTVEMVETDIAAALRQTQAEALGKVAAAYQIVGSLSNAAGLFNHPDVQEALTFLSNPENSGEILPWPKRSLIPTGEK